MELFFWTTKTFSNSPGNRAMSAVLHADRKPCPLGAICISCYANDDDGHHEGALLAPQAIRQHRNKTCAFICKYLSSSGPLLSSYNKEDVLEMSTSSLIEFIKSIDQLVFEEIKSQFTLLRSKHGIDMKGSDNELIGEILTELIKTCSSNGLLQRMAISLKSFIRSLYFPSFPSSLKTIRHDQLHLLALIGEPLKVNDGDDVNHHDDDNECDANDRGDFDDIGGHQENQPELPMAEIRTVINSPNIVEDADDNDNYDDDDDADESNDDDPAISDENSDGESLDPAFNELFQSWYEPGISILSPAINFASQYPELPSDSISLQQQNSTVEANSCINETGKKKSMKKIKGIYTTMLQRISTEHSMTQRCIEDIIQFSKSLWKMCIMHHNISDATEFSVDGSWKRLKKKDISPAPIIVTGRCPNPDCKTKFDVNDGISLKTCTSCHNILTTKAGVAIETQARIPIHNWLGIMYRNKDFKRFLVNPIPYQSSGRVSGLFLISYIFNNNHR
jgi:hypothetical protein